MTEPKIFRGAFETTGTPRFVMYTIQKLGLDAKHGFKLEISYAVDQVLQDLESVEVALQDGTADLIDIDWISIARERAHGAPIVAFFPYGQTVGSLVVRSDSAIRDLKDLKGRRIGVVRVMDKNWVIARAFCRKFHGFDPQDEVTVVEALSKARLTHLLEQGEVEGGFHFWQMIPPLTLTGKFRTVVDVADLIQELAGTAARVPIAAFITRDEVLKERPDVLRGFSRAFREVAAFMSSDDQIWEELGGVMLQGADRPLVHAIRDGWRKMVMTEWTSETIRGIERLFKELLAVGGKEVLGIDHIPPGTFTTSVSGNSS
ncbi:MAG: ABC transporter substrate-binding protein [Candidatus Methylomirabilales bacterium]